MRVSVVKPLVSFGPNTESAGPAYAEKLAIAFSTITAPASWTKWPASASSSGGGQFRMLARSARIAGGPRTGSCMPIAMKLLPVQFFDQKSRARREGRRPRRLAGPARDWGSAARRTCSARPGRAPHRRPPRRRLSGTARFISAAMSMSGLLLEKARQARKPSPSGTSPVPRPVFMTRSRSKRVGHVHRNGEPDEAAPVLADEGDALEVERLDEGDDGVAMKGEGVGRLLFRLVRAAEAEKVRRDDAESRREGRESSCGRDRTRSAGRAGRARPARRAGLRRGSACARPRRLGGNEARRRIRASRRSVRPACAELSWASCPRVWGILRCGGTERDLPGAFAMRRSHSVEAAVRPFVAAACLFHPPVTSLITTILPPATRLLFWLWQSMRFSSEVAEKQCLIVVG